MLLLIGFPDKEVSILKEKINDEIYPIYGDMKEKYLQEIIDMKMENKKGERILNQRIVIMHNIPKEEIGKTITEIRELINGHIIFATSTPTSLQWKISDLIEELLEEDRYFRKSK